METQVGMKKVAFIAGAGALLAALLAGAWFTGLPAYRRHKESAALGRAKEYMARKEFAKASLDARITLALNRTNLEACRIMASLAEIARSPALLDWRRRIAELEPTPENKLMFASALLRQQAQPYAAAAQVLAELSGSATNLADFHLVSAELALKRNRPAEAEPHIAAAAALEPGNPLHQVNLSVLRLGSTNQALAAAARATLARLAADTNFGAVALRWLVASSLAASNRSASLSFSRQLLENPQAGLEDQLQHLDVLKQAEPASLPAYLGEIQRRYATNGPSIHVVAAWMAGNGLTDDAITWLKALAPETRAQQPVQAAMTECYFAKSDWSGVESYLAGQKWKELDFLRYAYRSRAAERVRAGLAVDAHWRSAVRDAGDRLGALMLLLDMSVKWNRKREREELLWRLTDRFPREKWALDELGRIFFVEGNTLGLNKVYEALLRNSPTNFVFKNNLATTSMLLKSQLPRAHELAQEVFRKNPGDPVMAATYGYSLHLQRRTGEGLAALEKLEPGALSRQPVALYYGVLLWAAGRTNEAVRYLDVAAADKTLLPEEKALLAASKPPRAVSR